MDLYRPWSKLVANRRVLNAVGFILLAFAANGWTLATVQTASAAEPKGLGPAGDLTELKLEPVLPGAGIVLRGPDSRQQLFVTGSYSSGQLRDETRSVTYTAEPAGIVNVDAQGHVTPVADGQAVVTAKHASGLSATVNVAVSGQQNGIAVDFNNQIVPIFTKLGCNGGGCHGKSGGQNGFRLSLLGFTPEEDFEYLVNESRGRRVFPAAPAQSLLLTKPVGKSPHGGGKRMEVESHEYRLIHRWIEQGMPATPANAPVVTAIKVLPEGRVMDRGQGQQITTYALYSDGTVEDVTRMALYEPNDSEMAEVSVTGYVKTLQLAGEVAIMARYQGQVSTFRATIPLGAEMGPLPASRGFIDDLVFSKLKVLGIPASPMCDDATFIRRVSLDITGKIPTAADVQAFVASTQPDKRDALVDKLVDSFEYADLFANKWNLVLRNKRRQNEDVRSNLAFQYWIRDALYENRPYDSIVRDVVAAAGDVASNPPVTWYREVADANQQVEDTAQLFLGMRLQCARCHHHPFEKWSQSDYYKFAAFFSRVGRKSGENVREQRVFHNEGQARATHPRTGEPLPAAGLGTPAQPIADDLDPRHALVDWMVQPTNPYFAQSLVNRYWKHFFDRGLVEPEDDMRETNPATNPELLNALAKHFVSSGFNLKDLVRQICKSSTYQLSSLPNEFNARDRQNYSRYYPRRLKAEVLFDALHTVTATTENYNGLPAGTSAVQLPDAGLGPYFLKVFGQPQADTACECERSQDANLAQSLHLLNSAEVQNKISSGQGRAAQYADDKTRSDEEKIRELYRWVYAREPNADELSVALAHIAKSTANPKSAYEDLIWALLNTKEFLFNH